MASYNTMLEQVAKYQKEKIGMDYLVSGRDLLLRDRILSDIWKQVYEKGKSILILDDSGTDEICLTELVNIGFQIIDGFCGKYSFSNFLNIRSLQGVSRMRELLGNLGYSENDKQKCLAYLYFIEHMEKIASNQSKDLDAHALSKYSAVTLIEDSINEMVRAGKIDERQKMYLLAKYSEVSSAGADLENILYLLVPFIGGNEKLFQKQKCAYVFSLKSFGKDQVMKKIAQQMIVHTLEDSDNTNVELIMVDEGIRQNIYLSDVVEHLKGKYSMHLLTGDVFSLGETQMVEKIFNCFNVRIYGRHSNMKSCEAISEALGQVQVVKKAYSESYDRRWRANSPWDMLFGKNKTEIYAMDAPVWEARYPKEMINSLLPGNGIIEYMGSSSVFSI